VFASIETSTELLSPVDQSVLALVKQVTSIDRASMRVGVRLTFENIRNNVKGNPWLTYFGSRFAWDSETAVVTRSVMGQAAGFRAERFESPDYVEVSDEQHRALICSLGRAYHRRSGPRMLDSLLIVEGESSRTFEFVIEFDQIYPLRTVSDVMTSPFILETQGRIPSLESSWILGLSARNVELVRTDSQPPTSDTPTELRMLLLETEGSACQCSIRMAAKPSAAFIVSGDGRDRYAIQITDQGVVVPLNRWQLREVLVVF
jgi:alpha-mannosidase